MNHPEPIHCMNIEALKPSPGYERLLRCRDSVSGLDALISVHSTALGPAAGGCRFWPYASVQDAIADVERLSRGMTFKNAAAKLPLGGGKAVIIGDPALLKNAGLMRAFGTFVDTLRGDYYTAEDVGVSPQDMAEVARQTRYVAGLDSGKYASGDPSPVTARGVHLCLREAVRERFGHDDLQGVRVAVQGLGHVGMYLAERLHADGAQLWVSDLNAAAVAEAVERFGATAVVPEAILAADVEVFAPCALGGVLSQESIPELKASVVAGAANNQLRAPECGDLLQRVNILYAPDYIVNGGGIVNAASEILGQEDPAWAEDRVLGLVDTLREVFALSRERGVATNRVADELIAAQLEV